MIKIINNIYIKCLLAFIKLLLLSLFLDLFLDFFNFIFKNYNIYLIIKNKIIYYKIIITSKIFYKNNIIKKIYLFLEIKN